ncbi:MAG TPA: DegT/DnrJ/EryC1/StrS family aminotransferase [Pyrinomonadaceae bacterium]|jgi:dTDP-4-amino-4,6-dideoxygalactose transaminase|nr:DegT/DnrJ/EryC1/StrS family aminotransferase [Pyrinomonadaceae bacterium]
MSLIPLFNPKHELKELGDQSMVAFQRVAQSGIYVNGSECQKFELRFAERCRIPFAIAVSSGTMALELLLRADGVGKGNRVITTAHTFVAVLEAILAVGAEPVFVDIDPETWQMACGEWPGDAVIVCHLYGGFSEGVKSNARLLYEDASQSFGGSFKGSLLGTLGRAGAISLYPTKNLSAMGDAGAIITHDECLASRLRALRNHGQTMPQVHDYCGTTGRMDELQAAILFEKLELFDAFLEARRRTAEFYARNLKGLPLRLPSSVDNYVTAPNLFVIRCEDRDELQDFLYERGIITGVHYPTPLHKMPVYRDQPWAQVSLPHTERLSQEILSLPLWFGISEEDQQQVVDEIHEFFEN